MRNGSAAVAAVSCGEMNLSDPTVRGLNGVRVTRVMPRAGGPALRLVDTSAEARPTPRVRRAVEEANRVAAGLAADDARWVLATAVAGEVQGGRAALVTPASRDRILATARRLGLRAFDANLVIAIVQDGARRGEVLGEDVEGRLTMIRPAAARAERSPMWLMAASIALAVVIAAGMIAAMTVG